MQLIVTDDNPRGEDPHADHRRDHAGYRCRRRRPAARASFTTGRRPFAARWRQQLAGDVVLVAGKGHEDYQIVGAERRAFSDADGGARGLAERGGA